MSHVWCADGWLEQKPAATRPFVKLYSDTTKHQLRRPLRSYELPAWLQSDAVTQNELKA